jgi:hypothetical protein
MTPLIVILLCAVAQPGHAGQQDARKERLEALRAQAQERLEADRLG